MNYSAFFIASLFVFLFSCNDSAKKKTIRSESSPEIDVIHDRDAQKVIIKVGGELFTSYLYNELKEKPFLYPLKSSQGNIVTRGWPLDSRPGERVDHPHQVGCWFNFGDVNGLDFWNNSYAVPKDEKHEYGSIKHKQVVKAESEDKKGVVTVKSDWIDHQGEILLAEEAKMIFYATDTSRTMERVTKLEALQDITFSDNKEGLFAIRMAREFEAPAEDSIILTDSTGEASDKPVFDNTGVNGHYLTSEGKKDRRAWGTQAKWVKLEATKNNEKITVAILDHPENIGHPPHWHTRYYGLFSVNNMGQQSFKKDKKAVQYHIDKGDTITFRHRLIINSGELTEEKMNALFESFSER